MTRRRRGPVVLAETGELRVEADPDHPPGRRLFQAGMEASYTDLADARHLAFDYLRWIRSALDVARARHILHIGGAGAALPRALALAYPDALQEVYEISPEVVAIARAHLGLTRRPGLKVRVGDGTTALHQIAGRDGQRDAVVIDAFLGACVAPGPVAPDALAAAAAVAPLTLINVVDHRGGPEVALIATRLASVYPRVWTMQGRSSNVVLVGDGGQVDLARLRPALAGDASPAQLTLR